LDDSYRINYQDIRIFVIFTRKINKIPEFYVICARKMPEFYLKIAQRIFFPNFWDASPCPAVYIRLWQLIAETLYRPPLNNQRRWYNQRHGLGVGGTKHRVDSVV